MGGQLSGRVFGKYPFAVYTLRPTVQKAINTLPLIFQFWYLYKQQKERYKQQQQCRLTSMIRVVYSILIHQNHSSSVFVLY